MRVFPSCFRFAVLVPSNGLFRELSCGCNVAFPPAQPIKTLISCRVLFGGIAHVSSCSVRSNNTAYILTRLILVPSSYRRMECRYLEFRGGSNRRRFHVSARALHAFRLPCWLQDPGPQGCRRERPNPFWGTHLYSFPANPRARGEPTARHPFCNIRGVCESCSGTCLLSTPKECNPRYEYEEYAMCNGE